jgi:23S rRNA (cytosine1962-C5)-methyltransferase
VGLFDPESPIRVRVLHVGKPQTIDAAWWSARLEMALGRRRGLFDDQTTGYRCINGESDGWPGLVLDRYDRTLVLKLYTAAWLPRLDEIVALLAEGMRGGGAGGGAEGAATNPFSDPGVERMVLRLSRNIQAIASERFSKADGEILFGPPVDGPVVFLETGLRFEAEVVRGQKTGFFLDQRENRRQVETLAAGRTVLNTFSFTGGFSLYAARGGAQSVTDLDISPHALAGAERNFELNRCYPAVAACERERIQADAFEWLAGSPRRKFGLIILDPPSLARREVERAAAIRAYGKLAAAAWKLLDRGGVLLASSCSAHVSAEEFFGAIRAAAHQTGRKFEELRTTRHAADHPATFKEGEYLKAIYLRGQ